MIRTLYHASASDPAIPVQSFWQASAPPLAVETPPLDGAIDCDVAVIGAGYTGLSAALRLAGDHGMTVRVLDAGEPGFGGSGRNGGFCCIPATKLSWTQIIRRFGKDEAKRFMAAQIEAIEMVRGLIEAHGIDADLYGHEGELQLSHSGWAALGFAGEAKLLRDTFGLDVIRHDKADLKTIGADGPGFYSGLTVPTGFGLHPLKYLRGLAAAAAGAGAHVHAHTPVTKVVPEREAYRLTTPGGEVTARQVIVATNGYTDEGLVRDLSNRLLPVISSIVVTRPMSEDEYAEQGFTTRVMAYDSRNLLHYFRRLPDGRFLFGGRGGTDGSPDGLIASRRSIRNSFETYFPAWKGVETTHEWSGLACVMANLQPYIGTLDWKKSMWGALGYHGNGVATGTWSGAKLADLIAGVITDEDLPDMFKTPPKRFPRLLSRKRLLKLRYWSYGLQDRL